MTKTRKAAGIIGTLLLCATAGACQNSSIDKAKNGSTAKVPQFSGGKAVAEHLEETAPYRGTWSWKTRNGAIEITNLKAKGDTLSGRLAVERSVYEGGGEDILRFSTAKVTGENGVWTMSFKGKLSSDLPVGTYVFRLVGEHTLKGYAEGMTAPKIRHRLEATNVE